MLTEIVAVAKASVQVSLATVIRPGDRHFEQLLGFEVCLHIFGRFQFRPISTPWNEMDYGVVSLVMVMNQVAKADSLMARITLGSAPKFPR